MEYKEVQKIAKDTIEYAKKNIYAGMSLIEIREMCERKMLELGPIYNTSAKHNSILSF